MGAFGCPLEALGASWGPPGGSFGPPWETPWELFGVSWGPVGSLLHAFRGLLGGFGGPLSALRVPKWTEMAPK